MTKNLNIYYKASSCKVMNDFLQKFCNSDTDFDINPIMHYNCKRMFKNYVKTCQANYDYDYNYNK